MGDWQTIVINSGSDGKNSDLSAKDLQAAYDEARRRAGRDAVLITKLEGGAISADRINKAATDIGASAERDLGIRSLEKFLSAHNLDARKLGRVALLYKAKEATGGTTQQGVNIGVDIGPNIDGSRANPVARPQLAKQTATLARKQTAILAKQTFSHHSAATALNAKDKLFLKVLAIMRPER